jgi:hypothetical protein
MYVATCRSGQDERVGHQLQVGTSEDCDTEGDLLCSPDDRFQRSALVPPRSKRSVLDLQGPAQ